MKLRATHRGGDRGASRAACQEQIVHVVKVIPPERLPLRMVEIVEEIVKVVRTSPSGALSPRRRAHHGGEL